MKRERILTILYDMAMAVGGEVNLQPLLTKTLQRLLFHTSFPCGMVFLSIPGADPPALRLEASIGDSELLRHHGEAIELPAALAQSPAELAENREVLAQLPCRRDYYSAYLRLPIDGNGVILLLSPAMPDMDLPFTHIFRPVLNNLAKSILLCRNNEAYTQKIIEDRKTAEAALLDLSYRNRLILESLGEGICGLDQNGLTTFINPAAARMLGYEPDELKGKPLHGVVHHETQNGQRVSPDQCPILDTIREGVPHRVAEDAFSRKSGTKFPVEYTSSPLREGGKVLGAVLVFQDITERKKAEEKIHQLAAIVQSSDDAIIGKTLDGIVLSWNKGAEKVYGYREDEILGRSVSALFPADGQDDLERILEQIRLGEHLHHYETRRIRKDGREIDVSLTVSPVRSAAGVILGASTIARDITDQKEGERRAKVINDLLRLFTETSTRKEYLDAAVHVLKGWSGCRNVGIRVHNPDGYIPFESCTGYSRDFMESEGTLSLSRDRCICTRIVKGEPDPAEAPAMTSKGSFYHNNTLALVAGLTSEELTRFRGVCMQHGYQSLAVIPIRHRDRILGALHLADQALDMLPLWKVEFLEYTAHVIGEAMFRFNMEEHLRRVSAYNRSLIEASMDPLVTIGPDGRITDVNGATEAATGCSRAELIGTDFSDYFTYPEKARAGFQQAFREGSVHEYPLEIRHRNGEVTSVLFNAAVYRDEQGRVAGVFAAARDVTARKLADRAMRLLGSIVEYSNDAIIGKDLTGTVTSWNKGAEKIFGYSAEDIAGRSVFLLVPDELRDEEQRILGMIKRGEQIEHYETLRKRKDGMIISVSLTVSPIMDTEGRIIGASTIARDITERKKAAEALRQSGIYNRSLIEASLDPLVTIGPDGKIRDVNAATETATGRSRQELVGADFSDYFTEPEKARAGYEQVFREGAVRDYALELRRSDGTLTPVLYNAAVYRDEAGSVIGMFAAARDITERRRAEEKLQETAEELRTLNETLEERIGERTTELEKKNRELERMNRLFVNRELQMVELKKRIRELEQGRAA